MSGPVKERLTKAPRQPEKQTIFRSTDPAVSVPGLSLAGFVMDQFGTYGDKPAVIESPTGRTLTYAQLAVGVRCVAAALARRGMSKGDVLAILLPNLPEYPMVLLGVAAAGGVVTTMNPQMTAEEIRHQLRDTGAQWLVWRSALNAAAPTQRPRSPHSKSTSS